MGIILRPLTDRMMQLVNIIILASRRFVDRSIAVRFRGHGRECERVCKEKRWRWRVLGVVTRGRGEVGDGRAHYLIIVVWRRGGATRRRGRSVGQRRRWSSTKDRRCNCGPRNLGSLREEGSSRSQHWWYNNTQRIDVCLDSVFCGRTTTHHQCDNYLNYLWATN